MGDKTGIRLVRLAVREIFWGLRSAHWATGGDEDRVDRPRLWLVELIGTGFELSETVGCWPWVNLGPRPDPDLGPRVTACSLEVDEDVPEMKSSRTLALVKIISN